MIFDIFKQTNFLDIVILIILFRICYIAAKMGLSFEIFKFLGVVFATYISLHYYTNVSDAIQLDFLPKGMPLEFTDFLVFVVLASVSYIGFVVFRSIFHHFVTMEAVPAISKFGGLFLGIARSFFVVGLLVYTLNISSISYLTSSVKHSYLGSRAFLISPNTYSWLWNTIFCKFSTKEKFNPTVKEVIDRFNRE